MATCRQSNRRSPGSRDKRCDAAEGRVPETQLQKQRQGLEQGPTRSQSQRAPQPQSQRAPQPQLQRAPQPQSQRAPRPQSRSKRSRVRYNSVEST